MRFGRRGRECRRGPRPGGIGRRIAGTRRLVPAVLALLVGLAGGLLPAGPGATAAPIPARDVVGSVQADRVSRATQAQMAPQPGFALESLRASRVAHPAYSVDVLYPRLTGLPGRVGERINARIAAFVDETAARFKAEVKALPSRLPAIATGPSTLIGGVTTDFDSAQIVSVSFSEYTYSSGAAHGITVDTTFNFDALTGRQYRLADLFNPSSRWLVALSRLSRRALSELLGSLTMASWIDSGTTPKESNFAAWALTPWGLQIAFGDYQVAAYAAGTSQITIPYASLAGIARASGPLALAAEEAASEAAGPSRMPLLPEVSRPASGECDRPRLIAAKGAIPSLFLCPGGGINVAAWDDLSQYLDGAGTGGIRMITLSGTPSLATVRAVMCADLGPGTFIDASTEIAIERLAAEYHGWRFPSPPAAGFPGFCHEGK